jgi:energy-coupling factor transporter ATP-binding protein EcfA2
VSTLPATHGEKVVIRVLNQRATVLSLESLGMYEDERRALSRLLEHKEGIVLVTGPTGSGKTTTLYSALRLVQNEGVNIVTVEDPVEYRLGENIVQVQTNEKAASPSPPRCAPSCARTRRRAGGRDPRPRDGADRGAGIARPVTSYSRRSTRRRSNASRRSSTWAWRLTRSPPRCAAWCASGLMPASARVPQEATDRCRSGSTITAEDRSLFSRRGMPRVCH